METHNFSGVSHFDRNGLQMLRFDLVSIESRFRSPSTLSTYLGII